MKSRKLFVSLIGLLIATCANGEIYQWKDKNGKTHYSDTQPPNSANAIVKRDENNLPGITRLEPQQFRRPVEAIYAAPQAYSQRVAVTNNDADWNSCADTKRKAVIAEKRRSQNAEKLNEWLWQNCRSYSNELREIERQMM
jgi:hypothetical protein